MTVCGNKLTGVCAMGKCPHFERCCPTVWDKSPYKPQTNFDRITASEEVLAEFIVDAMIVYDGNRHIFVTDAIEMANKKKVDFAVDNIYKNVAGWLKQESESRRVDDK